MKAAILFDNIGPYHAARLRAATEVLDVLAVQFGSLSVDYAWSGGAATGLNIATVNPEGAGQELPLGEFRRRLEEILEGYGPEVVFVNGWGFRGALMAISWARRAGVRVVVMSETRRVDGARSWLGEWVKSRIVGLCDAGLCGGELHRRYLEELGLAGERVVLGYNAVDNEFFGEFRNGEEFSGAGTMNKQNAGPYFLASNRFVQRKNLTRLIRAYAKYVESFQGSASSFQQSPGMVWPLVLLGDGELRGELEALCGELGIKVLSFQGSVFSAQESGDLKLNSYKLNTPAAGGLVVFAGFRQIEELPAFYSGAAAFIHPALAEPWGLVINEAMASGVLVISSRNVGAAEELVREGVNGFSFDPEDVEELAGLMGRVAGMSPEERLAMGEASRRLIAKWGPERFARGAGEAARLAIAGSAKRAGVLDRVLLEVLIRK